MVIPFGANLNQGRSPGEGEELQPFSLSKAFHKKRQVSKAKKEGQEQPEAEQPLVPGASLQSRPRPRGSSSASLHRGPASELVAEPVPPIPALHRDVSNDADQSVHFPLGRLRSSGEGSSRPSSLYLHRNTSSLDLTNFTSTEQGAELDRIASNDTGNRKTHAGSGDSPGQNEDTTQKGSSFKDKTNHPTSKPEEKKGAFSKLKSVFSPGFRKSSKNTSSDEPTSPISPIVASSSDQPVFVEKLDVKGKTKESLPSAPLTKSKDTFLDRIDTPTDKSDIKGKGKAPLSHGYLTTSSNPFDDYPTGPSVASSSKPTQPKKVDIKGKGKAHFSPGFLIETENTFNEHLTNPTVASSTAATSYDKVDIKGKGKAPIAPGSSVETRGIGSDHVSDERIRKKLILQNILASIRPPPPTEVHPALRPQSTTQGPQATTEDSAASSSRPPRTTRFTKHPRSKLAPSESRPGTAAGDYKPRQGPVGRDGSQFAHLIISIGTKRMMTFEYLKKLHAGNLYWFNTLLFTSKDLERLPWFEPTKVAKRTKAYFHLGVSLCAVLDVNTQTLGEYMATLAGLMVEWEQYQAELGLDIISSTGISRVRVPELFKRVASGQQGRSRRTSDMGAGQHMPGIPDNLGSSGNEYKYLLTPHIPFPIDYCETYKTLMDAFIDAYTNLLNLVESPENALDLQSARVVESWSKADQRIKHALFGGLSRDLEAAAVQGMRGEVAGVARLAFGGLA